MQVRLEAGCLVEVREPQDSLSLCIAPMFDSVKTSLDEIQFRMNDVN